MTNDEQPVRHMVGNEGKPQWQQGWGRFIVWLLAGALIAGLFILLTEQRSDAAVMECSAECPTVLLKHKNAAQKYKDGQTGRSNGFNVNNMFANPEVAKDVFGRRIGALMKRQAEDAAARQGFSPLRIEVPVPGECQDWRCAGIREYKRLTDTAGCVDRDPAIFPPNMRSCTVQDHSDPFTNEQIRDGGKVVVCAGMFAIAVGTRTQQFGSAVAALTGTNCTFALWDLVD